MHDIEVMIRLIHKFLSLLLLFNSAYLMLIYATLPYPVVQ